jgi:hypothetical protein
MTNVNETTAILLYMERSFMNECVSRCDGPLKRPNDQVERRTALMLAK